MIEPMQRDEAESDIATAADFVRRVLLQKVTPTWLWDRNVTDLRVAADLLETAAMSLAMDSPHPGESDGEVHDG